MSRGYNARRKARRQQPPTDGGASRRRRPPQFRRSATLLPVLIIAAILAAVGILGFGANGPSKEEIQQEVTELLSGIPQKGRVLGSPKAPITIWVYGDLKCPTVKLFVENHLPSIIETWVRTGAVRLDYRSLQTDTLDEEKFFKQETAALAAGRQNRMWNFALTFVRQQGDVLTDYVTEEFLADIAAQVPGLEPARWRRDRVDALLSRQVALGVHSGHTAGFRSTPSFLIGYTEGEVDRRASRASLRREFEAALQKDIESLRREASDDFPILRLHRPGRGGGLEQQR